MGIYNTYGKVQLKVEENCTLTCYKVGDKVLLKDGIYVGYEGCIVVKDGIFIAEFSYMINKWGGILTVDDIHR